jgi:hypothetical protein
MVAHPQIPNVHFSHIVGWRAILNELEESQWNMASRPEYSRAVRLEETVWLRISTPSPFERFLTPRQMGNGDATSGGQVPIRWATPACIIAKAVSAITEPTASSLPRVSDRSPKPCLWHSGQLRIGQPTSHVWRERAFNGHRWASCIRRPSKMRTGAESAVTRQFDRQQGLTAVSNPEWRPCWGPTSATSEACSDAAKLRGHA